MINTENFKNTCDCICTPDRFFLKEQPTRIYVSSECNQPMALERIILFLKTRLQKYELVYHGTDLPFDKFKFETVKHYVKHIYAVNCEIEHPMITQLPLGFRETIVPRDNVKKDILCYSNHSHADAKELKFTMAISLRQDCRAYCKTQSFVTIDENIPFDEFLNKMYRSKFIICPFGYGLDTFRFYEAYAAGATPIVITSGLDPLYKKFGALIVDSWSDVTEELLNNFIKQPFDAKLLEVNTYLT